MSGEFLSVGNLNHLISITNRFLYDKYNFRMMETVSMEELKKEWQLLMMEVFQNFNEQGMGKEFQKMNMKVLSTMKDRIKDRFQLQISPEKAFTNAMAQQSVVVSVPVQGNPIEPEERVMDNALEEDEFMDKVRLLENQRRTAPVTPVAPSIPVPPTTQPPLKLEPAKPPESNYVQVFPTPIPHIQNSGLANNSGTAKKERFHYISIHAKDRNWVFSPSRQSWVWSGSLPANANLGSLRLSALMLPHWIQNTPYVVVEITGAGGQKMRSICLFKDGSANKGWLTLKPLNRSDEMRPLATPWTIALLDAFDAPLTLGEDTMIIKGCETITPDQYRVSLNSVPNNTKITIGDVVELGNGVQATVMRDIYIVGNISYLFLSSTTNLSQMIGKNILVKSAQPSLIFELRLDE